ncbi:MAG: hypothetical protein KKA64_03650 [Nanoarchaeota archaeon]|nr:hypothetical protein [Nanoarchaeota archaeon]
MELTLIQEKTFESARNEINKAGKDGQKAKIIFSSNDDELNRKILEKEKIDILLLNQAKRKDFQKQRNSGLNQVMAKLAKSTSAAIGINLDEIIEAPAKAKSEILARVKQNIKLCNKAKVKMKFIIQNPKNKRDAYDLRALGLALGMPTWMVKEL